MTVALGLICSDGVIVASDSMASDGLVALSSVKVRALANIPVVWTASGSVYVIEEVASSLRTEIDDPAAHPCPKQRAFTTAFKGDEVRRLLTKAIHPTMKASYEAALPFGLNQQQNGQHPFSSSFVVVGFAEGEPWFLEYAADGQINWHTDRRFYAIGSGQQFASVASALLTHYMEGTPLALKDGLQVAYRVIETTCEVSSAHVGPPVQLAVADANGARVLTREEVDEVQTGVTSWKQLERDTLRDPGNTAVTGDALPTVDITDGA